jgi:hypothetical protein
MATPLMVKAPVAGFLNRVHKVPRPAATARSPTRLNPGSHFGGVGSSVVLTLGRSCSPPIRTEHRTTSMPPVVGRCRWSDRSHRKHFGVSNTAPVRRSRADWIIHPAGPPNVTGYVRSASYPRQRSHVFVVKRWAVDVPKRWSRCRRAGLEAAVEDADEAVASVGIGRLGGRYRVRGAAGSRRGRRSACTTYDTAPAPTSKPPAPT